MSTPVASDLSELKVIKKAGPNFIEVKSMQLAPFSTSHQRGRLDQQPVFALHSKWFSLPLLNSGEYLSQTSILDLLKREFYKLARFLHHKVLHIL